MLFLPPYSPDLNPIEEAFSKVKSEIKHLKKTMYTSDIEIVLLAAFTSGLSRMDFSLWDFF